MKIPEDEEKGYYQLFLQIFQLKNFLLMLAGGSIFIPIYSEEIKWARVQILFFGWLTLITIWFILILFIYRGQLVDRMLFYIKAFFKKLIPFALIIWALYMILIPFDYKKTLGVLILIPIITFYLKGPKKLQKVSKKLPAKRTNNKKTRDSTRDLQVSSWVATETNNRQGTDFREINLENKPLKSLEFKVIPTSEFWRAGFKITDANGSILPLRNDNSFLFHVGSSDLKDKFGVTAYQNSVWLSYLNKTISFGDNKYIVIKFEVNEKNFVKCFINGSLEFELKGRINPQILTKVFLAAWGDGNPYKVEFRDINYELRT